MAVACEGPFTVVLSGMPLSYYGRAHAHHGDISL